MPPIGFPPAVTVDFTSGDLRAFWWTRVKQCAYDTYAGVWMCKLPEDLRTYEHLIWESAPDTVIEIGTRHGGGTLWLRDRLRMLRSYDRIARDPHVISIDVDHSEARAALEAADPSFAEQITLVSRNATDPALPEFIAARLRPNAHCMVLDDSSHTTETTRATLHGFAQFIPIGGYLIIEDSFFDDPAMILPEHLTGGLPQPNGALTALDEWLGTADGEQFIVRNDLELYGLTANPRGILQRREVHR